MSEFQDHEFRAIDRLLTDRQMRELRTISTRAAISRTSFSKVAQRMTAAASQLPSAHALEPSRR